MTKKKQFNFQEYLNNQNINKYVKEGFIRTINEEPKTKKKAETLLKTYLRR